MLGAMLSARGHKHVLSIGDSQGHGLLMSPMAQHQSGDCLEHPSSMLPPQCSPPLQGHTCCPTAQLWLPQKRGGGDMPHISDTQVLP